MPATEPQNDADHEGQPLHQPDIVAEHAHAARLVAGAHQAAPNGERENRQMQNNAIAKTISVK